MKKKSDKIVEDAEAAMMDWFKDFLRNNVPGAEENAYLGLQSLYEERFGNPEANEDE